MFKRTILTGAAALACAALVCGASLAQTGKPYEKDANTVLLLHLDEKSGDPADSSGKGHAVIIGKPSGSEWGQKGVFGGAISLSGKNYVEVDYNPSLEPASFTMEFWLKPEQPDVDSFVLTHGNTNKEGYFAAITKGKIGILFSGIGGVYAETPLEKDKWYHFAATYDAATKALSVYLNGVMEKSVKVAPYTAPSMYPLRIGTYAHSLGAYYVGLVDEVRISDKVRKPEELVSRQ